MYIDYIWVYRSLMVRCRPADVSVHNVLHHAILLFASLFFGLGFITISSALLPSQNDSHILLDVIIRLIYRHFNSQLEILNISSRFFQIFFHQINLKKNLKSYKFLLTHEFCCCI